MVLAMTDDREYNPERCRGAEGPFSISWHTRGRPLLSLIYEVSLFLSRREGGFMEAPPCHRRRNKSALQGIGRTRPRRRLGRHHQSRGFPYKDNYITIPEHSHSNMFRHNQEREQSAEKNVPDILTRSAFKWRVWNYFLVVLIVRVFLLYKIWCESTREERAEIFSAIKMQGTNRSG